MAGGQSGPALGRTRDDGSTGRDVASVGLQVQGGGPRGGAVQKAWGVEGGPGLDRQRPLCCAARDRTAGALCWAAVGRGACRVRWGTVGRARQVCPRMSNARRLATDQQQLPKARLRPAPGSREGDDGEMEVKRLLGVWLGPRAERWGGGLPRCTARLRSSLSPRQAGRTRPAVSARRPPGGSWEVRPGSGRTRRRGSQPRSWGPRALG